MNVQNNFIKKVKNLTLQKIKHRLWAYFGLKIFRNTWIYYFLYKSYWHSILNSKIGNQKKNQKNYMSINVDPGAGIGHQISNYNACLWHAKKLNLIHTHTPFPNKKWEKVLGFNFSSICSKNILDKNYKKIKLPHFKEKNSIEVSKVKNIIRSYYNKKVIFFLEFNQSYKNQYGVAHILQKIFFSSKQRKKDNIIFKKKDVNIAVHIRLPMIIEDVEKRYNDANYTANTVKLSFNMLDNFLKKIKTKKKIKIFLFTQFYNKNLEIFKKFTNVKYCYKVNLYKSFISMIFADVLFTSRSSFSYKPALISKGIKVSPKNFWHGYPKNDKNWILANSKGKLIGHNNKIIIK